MSAKYNILFHAINGIGLGHIRRAISVVKELSVSENIGRIVFLTNSTHTELIEQAGFIVEKINIGIEDTMKNIAFSDYESSTEARLSELVRKYDISTVVHDTFFIRPFILEKNNIEHFLILRDSDLSYIKSISPFFKYFRKIFYPHIKDEITPEKKHILSAFPHIEFTWYVVTPWCTKSNGAIKNDIILVSPGLWGDLDQTTRFFSYVFLLLEDISFAHYRVVFTLGKHADFLRQHLVFPQDSEVLDFISDMWATLRRVRLFIGRGGYNTLNEIVFTWTKAILFNADRVSESQSDRIGYFEKRTNFVHAGTWDVARDSVTISSLLSNNIASESSIPSKSFRGARNIARIIESELWRQKVLIYKHIFLPKSEQFLKEEFCTFAKIKPVFLALKHGEMPLPTSLSDHLSIPEVFSPLLTKEYPVISDQKLYVRFLQYVALLMRKQGIQAIYTPFLPDACFLVPLKRIVPDLRIHSGARGFDAYSFLPNLPTSPQFLSELDGVFVRDRSMQSFLTKINPELGKIRVVRSVLPLKKYNFSVVPLTPLRIFIGGRFIEKKGILPLLDLLHGLSKSGYPIEQITLVWSWILKDEVSQKIQKLRLQEKIVRHEFLLHKELLSILSTHNCHICYSRKAEDGDDEWIPNLLLENMLSGNLIFSTLTGGIVEVIEDWKTGIMLSWDPNVDLTTILSALRILESDHLLYNQILDSAQKTVRKIFSPRNSVELLESLLLQHESVSR